MIPQFTREKMLPKEGASIQKQTKQITFFNTSICLRLLKFVSVLTETKKQIRKKYLVRYFD